uniref:Cysteine rich secreted protein n=1 Tax=Riptortus pedestris TaxID=329032 RepID=R4WDB6_RIPPE|nr:cysteine rich secreted protein [Riptortus pedestris]
MIWAFLLISVVVINSTLAASTVNPFGVGHVCSNNKYCGQGLHCCGESYCCPSSLFCCNLHKDNKQYCCVQPPWDKP